MDKWKLYGVMAVLALLVVLAFYLQNEHVQELKRLADEKTIEASNAVASHQVTAGEFKKSFEELLSKNVALAEQVKLLQSKVENIKFDEHGALVSEPIVVHDVVPHNVDEHPCLLHDGDSVKLELDFARGVTSTGAVGYVGEYVIKRVTPTQAVLGMGKIDKADSSLITTNTPVSSKPEPVNMGKWGFGADAQVDMNSYKVGPVVSPPPVALFKNRAQLESFYRVTWGPESKLGIGTTQIIRFR
jgi:cell division protein FtsB